MKKNQTVQGTFSKLFGKKHASPDSTSLYATNPPWIFTQEAPETTTRDFDGIYYGDHRFDTVSESGTATLKARPRVRPLLTFLPLNAQENHGLAVPTPSVPEDFADKAVTGSSSLVNGNLRLYSSVGDLRPVHYGEDPLIPPPPPGPAPGPPEDVPSPAAEESPPPPPPATAPPPPPLLLEPPPPPSTAPPPPPAPGALSPPSTVSSPSTPTPPDFIPPAPPMAFSAPPPPPMPAPTPPAPASPRVQLFPPGSVTKWKSEVALNGKQPEVPRASPPRSPAELNGNHLQPNVEPHLTFPRSFKVPPPTPVRTSSIPVQEAQGAPPQEEGITEKAPSRLSLPPTFHIRPASQVYPDKAPDPDRSGELKAEAPDSLKLCQSQSQTNEQAAPPPPPAPPLPPPAPPLPPAAPPLPSAEKAAPAPAGFTKSPKSISPALKPKPEPKPPSPEDTASSSPVDWRDPSQMEKLRSELAAYLCGSRREDRSLGPRPGSTVTSQSREDKRGPDLPEAKESPYSVPGTSSHGEDASLALPPVDYVPQDSPTPSVQQLRNELEARLSSTAQREGKPSLGSLPPKPRLEGGRIFENGMNGKFSKPGTKDPSPLPSSPLAASPLQAKATPGPAIRPKATPGPAIPPKASPGSSISPKTSPGPATPVKASPVKATPGPAIPPKASPAPSTSPKTSPGPGTPVKRSKSGEAAAPSPPKPQGSPLGTRAIISPMLPAKTSPPNREEAPFVYKPHRGQNNPSHEVAMVTPTLAQGETSGLGGLTKVPNPQNLPAISAKLAATDQLLRHPVTGEVVEQGSPMALLLAARQRAQKGRPSGTPGLGRSSLPGSLRNHSSHSPAEASSDSIFYSEGRPNSFTVVPRLAKEAEKDSRPASSSSSLVGQPSVPNQWTLPPRRDTQDMEPNHRYKLSKAEPQPLVAWERPAPSNLRQSHLLPKSFSSPPSPSLKWEEEEEEEFNFEVIPPPPEFSNDPEPMPPAVQYQGRRGSPPQKDFSDLGQPLGAPPSGFSRFPRGAVPYSGGGTGGPERSSGTGRSLIKKRLYVGETNRSPTQPPGGPGRSLSTPNCFGPQSGSGGPFTGPAGPEMRRVNSAGRMARGGLQAPRPTLEGISHGGGTAEAKARTGNGGSGGSDYSFASATVRSPRSSPHYGSPINTFTVRPGTRHPISYAYSGTHRKAVP
ncbi:uncharacterized protein C6orf132 homolog [Ochotona curzoniae]|uniref:uncharacterized protein C6orf132 homolog n=1 Tax=Ochotona curzoniae TaxID=130825 RepID=UPI001B34DBC6|nr:uncharacterized protein C6orf132 homolog [Ochotona curzoniae]